VDSAELAEVEVEGALDGPTPLRGLDGERVVEDPGQRGTGVGTGVAEALVLDARAVLEGGRIDLSGDLQPDDVADR